MIPLTFDMFSKYDIAVNSVSGGTSIVWLTSTTTALCILSCACSRSQRHCQPIWHFFKNHMEGKSCEKNTVTWCFCQEALLLYERFGPIRWLRKRSTDFAFDYIKSEDLGFMGHETRLVKGVIDVGPSPSKTRVEVLLSTFLLPFSFGYATKKERLVVIGVLRGLGDELPNDWSSEQGRTIG